MIVEDFLFLIFSSYFIQITHNIIGDDPNNRQEMPKEKYFHEIYQFFPDGFQRSSIQLLSERIVSMNLNIIADV